MMFNQKEEKIWVDVAEGHINTGWAARLGQDGEPVVLGVKVAQKIRTADGERRTEVEEFTYLAFRAKKSFLGSMGTLSFRLT